MSTLSQSTSNALLQITKQHGPPSKISGSVSWAKCQAAYLEKRLNEAESHEHDAYTRPTRTTQSEHYSRGANEVPAGQKPWHEVVVSLDLVVEVKVTIRTRRQVSISRHGRQPLCSRGRHLARCFSRSHVSPFLRLLLAKTEPAVSINVCGKLYLRDCLLRLCQFVR